MHQPEHTPHNPKPQPFWEDPRFYLGDARAIQIRDLCISTMRELLAFEKGTSESRDDIAAVLERLNGRFIEAGIQLEMHVGKPVDFFRESPTRAAEYMAGQLMNLFEPISASDPSLSDTFIAATTDDSEVRLLNLQSDPRMKELLRRFSYIEHISKALGATDEVYGI